jgi:hypothetical protein
MAAVLRLPPGEDILRHTVAAHALVVSGHETPDPMTVLRTEDSPATDLVCALVDGLEGLGDRPKRAARDDLVDRIVSPMYADEVGRIVSELDVYVRPQDGSILRDVSESTQREQLRAFAAGVVHAIGSLLGA